MAERTGSGAPCTSCGDLTTQMGIYYTAAAGVVLLCPGCDRAAEADTSRVCAVENVKSPATAEKLRAGVDRLIRTIRIAQSRPQG